MKTQFQPGERVNVYGASQDGQLTCVEAKAGTVEAFSPNGLYVRVRFGMAHAKDFHVKQCRRLVRKPRREMWINPVKDCRCEHKGICTGAEKFGCFRIREIRGAK